MATDTITLEVLAAKVDMLREDVSEIKGDVVTRGEWLMRNELVNERFTAINREIVALRKDIESRRAPWWTWVATALAVLAFLGSMFGPTALQ